jgi:hypothetical protein
LFADKLALCCSDSIRPHLSTDGYNPYHTAIPSAFGNRVDHEMLIKQYASPTGKGQQRYSPATIIGAKHYQNAGQSRPGQICTSHVERSNLTIRMQNRRFTRLTNAFSKKWENHELIFALFVVVQSLPRSHDAQDDAGRCGWDRERAVDVGAAVKRIGESDDWVTNELHGDL